VPWLRGFLRLDYGVASPDTFERVFALLDPKQFEQAFRTWVGGIIPAVGKDQVIAIDGKSSRRTTSKAAAAPLHLVSAFAANVGVVLGQTATAEKSNEITAIPELLKVLDIEGCIVTIDAMGTQTKIARAIRERGAHYVLCVKDNHPKLLDSIIFADIDPRGPLTPFDPQTTSTGHGRFEVRRCTAFDATDRLHKAEAWKDVASFAVVERVRTVGERTSTERATTSAACRPTPSALRWRSEVIGKWRIGCTGVWMFSSVTTTHADASVTLPTTWRWCATWRSISSGSTSPSRRASRPSGCWPRRPMSFGLRCWASR
jgi:hypothetical protein